MPPPPQPPRARQKPGPAAPPRDATLQEFRNRALLFGALTILGGLSWFSLRDYIPAQLWIVLLGSSAMEAIRSFRRWQEWRDTQPHRERVHPDRVAAMQKETVKVMADAVKARAWFTRSLVLFATVPSVVAVVVGLEEAVRVASVDPAAVREGEWWRLLGGTYLHGGYYHFAGNMGALLLYGAILESKTSRLRLPLVYLLSCLGGSVLSVLIPPEVPSIGASGGVVGLIGYLFVFSRRQDVKFPAAFRGATASVLVGLITAGALGFWYIDNPGHAGGVLTGVFLAGLMVDTARSWDEELPLPFLDMLGWLAFAVLAAGSVVTTMALVGA